MFKMFKKITALAMAAVTAGALGLSAFAGGPRPQEDELAAASTESDTAAAAQGSLPSTLKLGVTYRIMSWVDTYLGNGEYEYYMLNVEDGADADQTSVNLKADDGYSDLKQQKFWLIPSGSYYKLGAVCSTGGRVIDAYRPLSDGCSVDIWSNTDDEAQQLVIGGNVSSGYTIRLKNGLALTAVSARDGGEVQFKTYDPDSSNQRWAFFDESSATSTNIKRPPYSYVQNKYNWCWAAAAKKVAENNGNGLNTKMTGDAQELDYIDMLHYNDGSKPKYWGEDRYGKPLADGAQRAIVIQVKGNDKDDYGTLENMEKALEYAHPNNADYKVVGTANSALSPDNQSIFKSKVQSEVQDGHYIMAGFSRHGSSLGHVVVVTGYNSATNLYTLYDPWNGTSLKLPGNEIFNYQNDLAGSNDRTYRLSYFFYTE